MNNPFTVSEVKLTYVSKTPASERPKVLKSDFAYNLLLNCYDADTIELRESFKLLLLNQSNRVLGITTISEGGTSETVVDIKLIMQAVILSNASNIIISHNHPSSNLTPSPQDNSITRRVAQACEIMGIKLCDHIILSPESYYSYADDGQL